MILRVRIVYNYNHHARKSNAPVGTLEPLFDQKELFFFAAFMHTSKTHVDIKFGKDVKNFIVVDVSLYTL